VDWRGGNEEVNVVDVMKLPFEIEVGPKIFEKILGADMISVTRVFIS
jgi:hypothetical protein